MHLCHQNVLMQDWKSNENLCSAYWTIWAIPESVCTYRLFFIKIKLQNWGCPLFQGGTSLQNWTRTSLNFLIRWLLMASRVWMCLNFRSRSKAVVEERSILKQWSMMLMASSSMCWKEAGVVLKWWTGQRQVQVLSLGNDIHLQRHLGHSSQQRCRLSILNVNKLHTHVISN